MIDPPKGGLEDHLSCSVDFVKNEGLTPVLLLSLVTTGFSPGSLDTIDFICINGS